LYSSRSETDSVLADPHATGVINAAIELFAVAIRLYAPKVQESTMEQIATFLSSQSLQRNPGRKAAMIVNIAVALLHALKVTAKDSGSASGRLNPVTEKVLQELLQVRHAEASVHYSPADSHRNSSLTQIQLSGQLVLKHLDDSVTVLETLL
jgi:hypothetical protein